MSNRRSFTAATEDALWQQVAADLHHDPDQFEYAADLALPDSVVHLDIDIDLGGGFESGFATTTFTAAVPGAPALRFALHEQDWLHELGKLLGLTDVEIGDPELDAAFIITTNDAAALRELLAPAEVRATLLRYQECRLTLAPATADDLTSGLLLTFTKEEALTEPDQLREVHQLLRTLLRHLAPAPGSPVSVAD